MHSHLLALLMSVTKIVKRNIQILDNEPFRNRKNMYLHFGHKNSRVHV